MMTIKCQECGQYHNAALINCPSCQILKDSSTASETSPSQNKPNSRDNDYEFTIAMVVIVVMIVSLITFLEIKDYRKNKTSPVYSSASTVPGYDPHYNDIPKTDGTIEPARHNDLEDLCKDYFYYRNKITDAAREGDKMALLKHQNALAKINGWLKEYNESDVQNMMAQIENNSPFAK